MFHGNSKKRSLLQQDKCKGSKFEVQFLLEYSNYCVFLKVRGAGGKDDHIMVKTEQLKKQENKMGLIIGGKNIFLSGDYN